jgi:hypothetical protein
MVVRSSATGPMFVSRYGKGKCYKNCDRVGDHGSLNADKTVTFHTLVVSFELGGVLLISSSSGISWIVGVLE